MIPEGGRPLLDPDRRYWRRQVNRRVRKARLARWLARVGLVLASNLAIGAVLVASVAGVVRHLSTTSRLDVTEIMVRGTHRTTPDAVRTALGDYVGKNLLEIDLGRVAESASRDPWVLAAAVKRRLPHALEISVAERTPAALALVRGSIHVIDETGFVMGPLAPGLVHDFPVLTGLDGLERRALAETLARGVDVLRRLREWNRSWTDRISELDLSRADRIGVVRVEPGPKIYLDPDRVDRNLGDWLRLEPEVSRRLGAVDYVDLRWSRRIVLSPSEPSPAKSE